jgi:hypothetical protein
MSAAVTSAWNRLLATLSPSMPSLDLELTPAEVDADLRHGRDDE